MPYRAVDIQTGDKKRVGIEDYSFISNSFAFVGVTRLELATSRPPDAYSNQLSYTPIRSNQTVFTLPSRFRGSVSIDFPALQESLRQWLDFQKRCKGTHYF